MPNSSEAILATRPQKKKLYLSPQGRQYVMLLIFLVGIWAIFGALHPGFFTWDNALSIISLSAVLGIVALGQVLTLIVGGFDLSTGGVVPLGGVTFALLVNAGVPLLAAIAVVVCTGLLVGVVNGVVIAYLKINPLITTLAMLQLSGGLALSLANGVQIPFDDIGDGVIAARGIGGVSNHVWLLLVIAILLFIVTRNTAFGRKIYAVGNNSEAAALAGIRTKLVTASAYGISGALSGLAGLVLASQLLAGSGTAGVGTNLTSLAAAILGGAALGGGRGGVAGTLTGVLIIGTLQNGMTMLLVPSFYQTMATGLVLLVAVAVSQFSVNKR